AFDEVRTKESSFLRRTYAGLPAPDGYFFSKGVSKKCDKCSKFMDTYELKGNKQPPNPPLGGMKISSKCSYSAELCRNDVGYKPKIGSNMAA
ncbi:hypothetical protein J6590_103807, partial [Homalodisca vitripennis]